MDACYYGKLEIVSRLLQYGASVDSVAHNGSTALHVASQKGYGQIAKTLLTHGAKVSAESLGVN